MEEKNLWQEIGNLCLEEASRLLKNSTATKGIEVETVENLVRVAIAIDVLNLRWAERNQSCAAVFPNRVYGQPAVKNSTEKHVE